MNLALRPVFVKVVRSGVELPEYQTEGAAGFDLSAAAPFSIAPGSHVLIPTGLAIATPPHHMLMLAARSSLYKRHGLILANGVGIVDQDYAGDDDEIKISVLNVSKAYAEIEQGERIAQGVFVRVSVPAHFTEVESLGNLSRGGFGSTGSK